jgi:tetratricopeptide (TPR) repeat protein
MDDWAKRLSKVDLYIQNELYNEAIALLNQSLPQYEKEASLYHLLGRVYSYMLLPEQAIQSYLQALALVKENQPETRAPIAKELGQLYWAIGKKPESKRWLTQALALYGDLGDANEVEEVQGYLDAQP